MHGKAEYEDLVGLWHDLVKLFELKDVSRDNPKWLQHDELFVKTLGTCNWTLEEWNNRTDG